MNIYIGWDSNEVEAYNACVNSININSEITYPTIPLVQQRMRDQGLYWRPVDDKAATQFSLTRFLVPYFNGYEGWALFIDCDFIITKDLQELFAMADDQYAVMCVNHNYTPRQNKKMLGNQQFVYPRKNWSSMMLLNCGHPSTQQLTVEAVNEQSPAWLHRMEWARNKEIGHVPLEWNWLEGEYDKPDTLPGIVHYTQGGLWFDHIANKVPVDYYEQWLKYCEWDQLKKNTIGNKQKALHANRNSL